MIDYREPMFLIFMILAVSLFMQIIYLLISIFQHLCKKYLFRKTLKTSEPDKNEFSKG